MKYKKDSHIAP